ncbi:MULTISPECIES: copper chaperone PCu(A)C [unclassified Modicisalibacter]|uniref:copper chaperone PCu(A)C n=1 Tax=unclassified Modicisalibacter TaxID=2679913 RepID=UPI001CC95A92|nr:MULTISPECIES: copper chaperone PCu(A)C [unclassified Modicisalibacter]MBZ9558919.1 copper chaperone PCu(A)C [Modicisalibacter sp. R2A 31.J]MBZ9575189.1 copper chaperone PCu(A)C [Modicisalibacter sp. MOD 31.J]
MLNRHHRGRSRRIPLRLAWGLLAVWILAGIAQADDLTVTQARLSLLPGDMPGAGYFELHNGGDVPVTLVGASSDAFKSVALHRSMSRDGMASMHAVPRIEIAPGETLEFAPKGYHLMFMKRSRSLSVGDKVEVTLEFAGEKALPVMFDVVSPVSM